MWRFNRKRFLVTLGVSILVWILTILIQFFTGYKARFSLFGSGCELTGFPIADCVYNGKGEIPGWLVASFNIFFWFWIIHLFTSIIFQKSGRK